MTKPNHRPKVLPESATVKTSVPREVADAIDALVDASGTSRAAFMRSVLISALQPFALINPEFAAKLPMTTYTRDAS